MEILANTPHRCAAPCWSQLQPSSFSSPSIPPGQGVLLARQPWHSQEGQETEQGGTVPGRMLAGAARGAKLVTLSRGRNLIKDGGRFATRGISKVSSRFSQGENQRGKYLPCVTQRVPEQPPECLSSPRWRARPVATAEESNPSPPASLTPCPPATDKKVGVKSGSPVFSCKNCSKYAGISVTSEEEDTI